SIPLSGAERLRQCVHLVRRYRTVSVGRGRSVHALLRPAAPTGGNFGRPERAAVGAVLWIVRLSLPKNQTQLSAYERAADAPQIAQLDGHGRVRGQGGDLLTKRQFCTVRGDRPSHHGLTTPASSIRSRACRTELSSRTATNQCQTAARAATSRN
uniref:Uncharacterized protein n=1 Tax=Anopheles atroparvus TaxID=41427 RepID=A0AAG5DBF4_ANOAO